MLAVLCTLLGAALLLYGSVFHHHAGTAPAPASELRLYRWLLGAGLALLLLAAGLWAVYLYHSGRCRRCWLCPAARKRRRLRDSFQTQVRRVGVGLGLGWV